jgi:hypothetical protein
MEPCEKIGELGVRQCCRIVTRRRLGERAVARMASGVRAAAGRQAGTHDSRALGPRRRQLGERVEQGIADRVPVLPPSAKPRRVIVELVDQHGCEVHDRAHGRAFLEAGGHLGITGEGVQVYPGAQEAAIDAVFRLVHVPQEHDAHACILPCLQDQSYPSGLLQ